jgi:AbiJ N-terminal domain 4
MNQEGPNAFSRRHGYSPRAAEITIREDAPEFFREYLFELTREIGLGPTAIKTVIGKVLRRPTLDLTNWDAIQRVFHECEWFRIYELAEAFYKQILKKGIDTQAEEYERCLNEYFLENGIGWQMNQGIITVRGPESFEIITKEAANVLESSGRQTASSEIHEALSDLSRRPNPDLTGAIHHSMAALECCKRHLRRFKENPWRDIKETLR